MVIDDAHRSVFQKYRAIVDFFDSLLVAVTATPKDEIERNTYGLFDLETGVPTDAYDLEEVVNLVFFKLFRSKTKFWQMVGRGTRFCPDLFGPESIKSFCNTSAV